MNWSEFLSCDSASGKLFWKERHIGHFKSMRSMKAANARCANKEVGTDRGLGRLMFIYKKKTYQVHRIVWEMSNGPIPERMVVDHINGDPSDNRLQNLRLATPMQNQRNCKLARNNTSGLKGVSYCSRNRKWRAQIRDGKKIINLGLFLTKGGAGVAYAKASIQHHGAYGRFGNGKVSIVDNIHPSSDTKPTACPGTFARQALQPLK